MKTPGVIVGGGVVLLGVAVLTGALLLRRGEGGPTMIRRPRPAQEERHVERRDPKRLPEVKKVATTVSKTMPRPEARPATREAAGGAHAASRAFWDDLAVLLAARPESDPETHRQAVLEETIQYLGLEKFRAESFRACSWGVLLELEQAWTVREELWRGVTADVGLDEERRKQAEREIQERYEAAKESALARLGAVLREDVREQELKARLDEWFDAVR